MQPASKNKLLLLFRDLYSIMEATALLLASYENDV